MKITAAVTASQGGPFVLEERGLRELRPDEALVRLAAAGICHTDLICRDQWYPVRLPAVFRHQSAGIVEVVGAGVTKVARGDRVGMAFSSCGSCPTCRSRRPSYCHEFFEYNLASSRPAVGSSVLGLWKQGRFPVERLMTLYDFDQIEQAARDAETGQTIKAVLRMA